MGIFTPIVRVDDDQQDFNWILQILSQYPNTDEFEEKLIKLNEAISRAEAARLYIEQALSNATTSAKAELRQEIATVLNECQFIKREVEEAKTEILSILDDAVEVAKSDLLSFINAELLKVGSAVESAEKHADRAQNVVDTAVENLRSENNILVQSAVNTELERAKNELDSYVQTKVDFLMSEIELAKSSLQTLINNKTSELNSAINTKLTETKELIESENENAVEAVKNFIKENPFYKRGAFTLNPNNWVNMEQTVSVPGVVPDSDVFVTHAPNSYTDYISCGVHLTEVDVGLLRFSCDVIPDVPIVVNVILFMRGLDFVI